MIIIGTLKKVSAEPPPPGTSALQKKTSAEPPPPGTEDDI